MSARAGKKPQKSKEMTWSEKELAKHMLKDKKRNSSVDGGSSKSSPKVVQRRQVTGGGLKQGLSSTAPAKRGSEVRGGGGKERLSSTATAVSSRGGGGRRERGHGRDGEPKKVKDSSSLGSVGSRGKMEARDSRRGREEAARKERGGREGEKEKGRREKMATSSSSSLREKPRHSQERAPAGPKPQPMKEVREGDTVEEDFEYEDEFEEDDYSDDFEEDVEVEDVETESSTSDDVIVKSPPASNLDPIDLTEVMQAIDAENKDLPRPLQIEPTPSSPVVAASSQGSQRSTSRRKFVDFSSAKNTEEKERVARVTKQRGQELLAMIELDVVTFDLFELHPLSEYELYMRSFGTAGARQVASQTGGETEGEGTQTEEVEVREKWVQWPPEDAKGYGGEEEGEEETAAAFGGGCAVRLTSFLKRASQVVSVLLEENVAHQSQTHSNQSQIPFCSSITKIDPPKELQGCTLTSVEFSHAHPHLLMTIHVPTGGESVLGGGGGTVCVWSTREPSQPQYLLVSQSPSVCGCFGLLKTPIVFSGTQDGCVLLWDLRETVAMHTRPPGVATPTGHTLLPRSPTFSTAALSLKSGHQSPIVSLSPISTSTPHSAPQPLTSIHDETTTIGLSFQLASLDRNGLLIIWVAVETKPHPQGSESDLGLIPNGRVKLVWSTSLDTTRSSPGSIPTQTLCVRFHSTDTNHLFLGTDEGTVLHRTRYSHRPIPRQYRSQTDTHCPCDVTSLSFLPWQPDYFLASYSNGNISLYHTKKEEPLVAWSESTNGVAVSKVEWAWHNPGVFLALDHSSNLFLWNLTEREGGPTHTYRRGEGSPAILSFSLSPSPSPSPSLTLCLSDSSFEIHHFSNSEGAGEQLLPNFTNYLHSL